MWTIFLSVPEDIILQIEFNDRAISDVLGTFVNSNIKQKLTKTDCRKVLTPLQNEKIYAFRCRTSRHQPTLSLLLMIVALLQFLIPRPTESFRSDDVISHHWTHRTLSVSGKLPSSFLLLETVIARTYCWRIKTPLFRRQTRHKMGDCRFVQRAGWRKAWMG